MSSNQLVRQFKVQCANADEKDEFGRYVGVNRIRLVESTSFECTWLYGALHV